MGAIIAARLKARGGEKPELPDMSYFDFYHDFEEHQQFLEDVAATMPDNAEIFVAGESLEGRPISGIHLWGRDGPGKHEAIIWHGTVHAREWIGAPVSPFRGPSTRGVGECWLTNRGVRLLSTSPINWWMAGTSALARLSAPWITSTCTLCPL